MGLGGEKTDRKTNQKIPAESGSKYALGGAGRLSVPLQSERHRVYRALAIRHA